MSKPLLAAPSAERDPQASTSDYVAVLGAAKRFTEAQLEAGYRLGAAVARTGKALLTGATTGIPYAAAVGACDHGGWVVGISPAFDARQHRQLYGKPTDFHHTIIYTGLGNDGRSPMIVRSAAIALFVGGEAGTLQEFTAAWLNGTPVLGVLAGSGGVTDLLPALAASFTPYGSRLVTSTGSEELVETACTVLAEAAMESSTPAQVSTADPVLRAIAALRPSPHVGFPSAEGTGVHGLVAHRVQTGHQEPSAATPP